MYVDLSPSFYGLKSIELYIIGSEFLVIVTVLCNKDYIYVSSILTELKNVVIKNPVVVYSVEGFHIFLNNPMIAPVE